MHGTLDPRREAFPKAAVFAVAFIVAVGAVLRLLAATGDLWVDEVWSLYNIGLAREAASWDAWIALFFHDNTHALNTLYMTIVGADAPAFVYRALAVVTGSAAVVVAALIGRRRGAREAVLAALLVALSYPLVHYSGEARGYGPMMMLAALLALYAFEEWLARPGWRTALLFAAVSVAGLLCHLTFAAAQLVFGLIALGAVWRRRHNVVSTLAELVPMFGPQAILLAAYGSVAVDNFVIGGGTFVSSFEALRVITTATFGLDPWTGGAVDFAVLAVALLIAAGFLLRRPEPGGVFLVLVSVLVPGLLAAAGFPQETTPRYFLFAALFMPILAARALAQVFTYGHQGKAVVVIVCGLYAFGNAGLTAKFYDGTRGDPLGALSFVAAEPGGPVVVAADPPLAAGEVLRYHARSHPEVEIVDIDAAEAARARWLVVAVDTSAPAPEHLDVDFPGGKTGRFNLAREFRHWGLSGATWRVYARY